MKLAWALIIIGVLLFTEGTIRMFWGVLGAFPVGLKNTTCVFGSAGEFPVVWGGTGFV